MPNPVFHLYQLQKIDLRSDSLKTRLKDIDRILNGDEKVARAESEFNAVDTRLTTVRNELTEIESQIRSKKVKIEQSESSLYSGTVKNPKELQDLQKEISLIKTAIAALEEHELSKMLEVEEVESDLTSKQEILTHSKEEARQINAKLLLEAESCRVEIVKLETESRAFIDQLAPDLISRYKQLREKKKGIAVSHIEENCCSICGAELTPAECQAAKSSSSILTCTSCGRIIYAG